MPTRRHEKPPVSLRMRSAAASSEGIRRADVSVTTETFAEKVMRLKQLAANAGADGDRVLRELGINPDAPIIDVEHVDVIEDEDEAEPEPEKEFEW
jgi:hypothetical protein